MPLAAKLAQPVGRLGTDRQLRLAIGLPLRDSQGLEALLQEMYDPASPKFHQYLTPQEFASRFGPTAEQYSNIVEFALSHHLKVLDQHPNRMVLDVGGSTADIEKAFGMNLRVYPHPKDPRTFYAPDAEPVLPQNLSILHISGLDDYMIPHPAGLRQSVSSAAVPLTGGAPDGSGSYSGTDFRGAYARGVTLTGTGQMVGLLEFDSYNPSDITSYQAQTATPNVPLINITLDDFNGIPSVANNAEVCLDIEMVSAMAPGLSAIIVYQGGPNGIGNDMLNRMATDNLARQLSGSWTFPIDATTEQIFLQFAAQGQSYFNASGDGGAYSGLVDTPSDDPNVTVVGGTTLATTGPGGAWSGETVWNRGGSGIQVAATGGGISTKYPIPSWQQPVSMSANSGSTTLRNLPDVAAVADNVWITYGNGSSQSVGGTSCSSPLWAAFTALVNQQAAGFGRPSVGFLNPVLYSLGLSAGYSTNFHDVITGNNTNSFSSAQFYAVPGFDLCTGWGSPFGQNLMNALAPRLPFAALTNVSATIVAEGCSVPNKALDPGETVTVNFALKNVGGVKTTNLVATLLADEAVRWPSAPQSYGVLSSGGASSSRSFTFTANGACGTPVSATLKLQDGPGDLGKIVFNFILGVPITIFTQNFDSVTAPALPSGWSTMASNGVSPWVTSTAAHDSAPLAAFADEPPSLGIEDLISPVIPIASPAAQLSFRHFYNTEADPIIASEAYDGGLLEIQIGTNDFVEILAAGGSFVAGGYDHTITTQTNSDSLFKGRQVWGGVSGVFTTTIVNLPSNAAGQNIRFRWRFAVDTGNFFGGTGWYIDTVAIRDGTDCCSPAADVQVLSSVSPEPVPPGQPLIYSIVVTNLGPESAFGVVVSNVLPAGVVFGPGSAGCFFTNGLVLCDAGTLSAGAATNYAFSVTPAGSVPFTNVIAEWSFTPDPDHSNNQATIVSTTASGGPPMIQLTSLGSGGGNLSVSVPSMSGLVYTLEYKNSLIEPVWTPLPPGIPGTGLTISLIDSNTAGVPVRFYRVTAR